MWRPTPPNTPPETPAAPPSAPPPLPEAPASVNCHITIAGRQVQLTLRDSDEARLLERLQAVLALYPMPRPGLTSPGGGLVCDAPDRAEAQPRQRWENLAQSQNR